MAEGVNMKIFRFNPLSAANTATRILNPVKPEDPIVEVENKSE